eukprot:s837_g26.t1
MGHPDPKRFSSFLKDTHADPRIIAGALEYQCDTCGEAQGGYSLARPAAIHAHLGFNEVVGMDTASWTNDVGEKFVFVHFLDEGTMFHLGKRCAEDSASQLSCFEDTWLSWAGPPKQVYLDPASEYTSEKWVEAMQSEDIQLKMSAAESHWQLGRVEAHGRTVKRMLDLMNMEKPIRTGEEFSRALRQVFCAKNSMSRIHGFTPEQAVLGIARRLPASVTSCTEAASHSLANSDGPEGSAFQDALRLRTAARKAFVEPDNCSSLRRALLRRSRPLRDSFEVGDWVLYWRKKGGNMRRDHGRWYGPARVAMVDGLKVVWLTHANKLIRASPEQLRPASLREWKAVRASEEAKLPVDQLLKRAGHQDYFDLGSDVPGFEDVFVGDVPMSNETEADSLPEPESVHPTPELRESLGMSSSDQCALDGGAYGRIDAPFLWFCEFRDELIKQGCTQHPLDPCVFGLYTEVPATNPEKKPSLRFHGCLGIHVDDGIAGGDETFLAMLKRVEARFKFGAFERREFKYTGIHFRQWDDGSIEYDQIAYIEKIQPVSIEKSRRYQTSSPLTEKEKSDLRSIVGALQYAAVHSRPDIAAKVGELQSAVNKATIGDLVQANRVLAEAKQHKVSLMVLPISPEELTFCAFSDASFLSGKQTSAHQGTLIFATTPEFLANKRAVVAPVAWTSKKVPRVVQSALGAEAAALSNTVDRLMWIRIMWAWIRNPSCDWSHAEKLLKSENTSALVTDCKSAYDLLTRTALPQCSEHRTTIECLLIRERLQENCKVRWVSSQAMLADCLTKTLDSQALRTCLTTGKYTLQDENHVLRHRSDKRQRLEWIKGQAVAEPPVEAESFQAVTCGNVSQSMQDFWKWGPQGELIRVHVRPRELKFTPIGVMDCPVELQSLDTCRVTQIGKNRSERDFWVGTNAAKNVGYAWTGSTTFFIKGV